MIENIDTIDLSVDYFVNRKCTPQWHLPESRIDFHNLMYLYEGKCDFYIDGKLYPLAKGDVVYAPYGIRRKANTFEDNLMQCYAVTFQVTNRSLMHTFLPVYIKAGIDDELILLFKQMNHAWLFKGDGYQLKCRALLMLVLYRLLQLNKNIVANVAEDIRINKVKQYISEHMTENIPIVRLSEVAGLNQVYFGCLFHKYAGCTVKDYINRLRIAKACELLDTGDCSVKETAFQCGFDDIYYFSKVFKKIAGVPPSRYGKIN